MAVGTRRRFYGRWIAACGVAELVGIGAAGAAVLGAHALLGGEPDTTGERLAVLAAVTLAGAVEGLALGTLQWRVLRARLPRLRWGEWTAVTVAVAVVGWLSGMVGPIFGGGTGDARASAPEPSLAFVLAMATVLGAGAGALFGAAQWLVLRRHAERAGRWVWIHVPAWAAAMFAIFLGTSLPAATWPAWAVGVSGAAGGLVAGLLLGAITGPVARWLVPWVNERMWSMRGRVAVVTGATAGIGEEVSAGLARLGAEVVLVCRDARRGAETCARIRERVPGASLRVVSCDLASLASVRHAASEIREVAHRLDVLVHDAGTTSPKRELTEDGIERTLAVDVVGPFLLTALLRDRLEAAHGRVVTLAGIYHRRGWLDPADLDLAKRTYDWLAANNQAQLGRVLFTAELARRAPRLVAVAVHPGAVLTSAQAKLPAALRLLVHTLARPAFVRAELGALPVLRLASRPELGEVSGRFFDRFTLAPDVPAATLAATFWHACEELTHTGETPDDRRTVRATEPGHVAV